MKNKRCLNSACRIALAMQQAGCLGERQGSEKAAEGQRAGSQGGLGWNFSIITLCLQGPLIFDRYVNSKKSMDRKLTKLAQSSGLLCLFTVLFEIITP